MRDYIDAAILGLIEGVTEFIPVSSTGHLIVGEAILNRAVDAASSGVFDVFIQVGAILAVIWARRERVFGMATGFFTDRDERAMALKILLAFIPAVVAGLLCHDWIKTVLFSPWVVAVSLVVGGVILLAVERIARAPVFFNMDALPFKTALGIGLCQLAALIPGVSRSGASIVGAEFLGVERKTAAEFSFFLAIPTICGAAAYDLYKNFDHLSADDLPLFAVGTVVAFISALAVVNTLIAFVGRYGFKPFGYYRIVAGIVLMLLLWQGVI